MVTSSHLPITENPGTPLSLPVGSRLRPVGAGIHGGVQERYIALLLMRMRNKGEDCGLKLYCYQSSIKKIPNGPFFANCQSI
ncbi:hypothetical protein MKMG_01471 [Methanogenium sp. MK-MG]|nr:hypothetical protein MKMG_01471 [Methanogenium sp. MK-MG]